MNPDELPHPHEIEMAIAEINSLTHKEMAMIWRFAPAGHAYLDSRLPYCEVFMARWKAFGQMTPEISKQIGLTPPS